MVTIYDVATAADVSPATVSRVLNANRDVSPEYVERVRAAVDQLGYRPNGVARNLRRKTTRVWGLVISDIENPFFTAMARGVEDVAQATDHPVVLCNADEDLDKEARYIDVAIEEQMAGVIISPASEDGSDLAPLLARDVPLVTVDRRWKPDEVDSVLSDNRLGAEQATAHLVERGFRRPACITGPERTTTGLQRYEGYRNALADSDIADDPHYVRFADFKRDGGRAATASLLDLDDPPDALFVANNLLTLGALEVANERGLDIPGDLAVVCIDELPWTGLFGPRLSYVEQPAYEMGREAARLLLDRSEDVDRRPRHVVLPPSLHVFESTRRG